MSVGRAALVDTLHTVETPEGVAIELRLAGVIPRSLAWGFDVLIRGLAYSVLGMTIGMLGDFGTGLMLVVMFLGEWFYPVVFELTERSATPGKRMMGLVVLADDGTRVSLHASILRNLLRFADFFPAAYLAGVVTMVCSRRFQRLGDIVASTVVVYAEGGGSKPRRVPVPSTAAAGAPVVFRPSGPSATPAAATATAPQRSGASGVPGLAASPLGPPEGLNLTAQAANVPRNAPFAANPPTSVSAAAADRPASIPKVVTRLPLRLSERRAVIDFVNRAPGLSRARVHEIAELLRPWVTLENEQVPTSVVVARLETLARQLAGAR